MRYDLLETIATGGMGQVFLAQRGGSPDVCVLKRVRPELVEHPAVLDRFQREAEIATLLDHPGIARTIDAGFDDGAFFIAMEFIAGQDLFDVTKLHRRLGEQIPTDFVASVGLRTLEALTYAHQARGPDGTPLGLVHRDLSPRNVMVTFDGAAKVIDFGVARANIGEDRTKTGVLLGTLRYLSPEASLGEKVDVRSDLYSLSVVLYEMFSGERLIEEAERADMIRRIVRREIPSIRHHRPEVPEDLAYALARGLAKHAGERWQSAAEYLAALRHATSGYELGPQGLAARMRAWFPEEEKRAQQRIAVGRRRFEEAGGDAPEQFEKTRTVYIVRSNPSDRSPKSAPRPMLQRLSMLLLAGATFVMLAAAVIARSATPVVKTTPISPPPTSSDPVVGKRSAQRAQRAETGARALPERAPMAVPRPPPVVETVSPSKRAKQPKPSKPRPDLAAMLAARGLTRADLEHQHSLDRLEPEKHLDEISFEGERLKKRIGKLRDLLKRTTLSEQDFREAERRLMDASVKIEPVMTPPLYRQVCAELDSLENHLSHPSQGSIIGR